MTARRSFYRKIAYLVAMVPLIMLLHYLGAPATGSAKGAKGGGELAQLRDEYNLSETDLGEVDPTGETIKLATFGLRGVAVNILWEKANRYKKVKDWTNLSATLKQITKLEPHFIFVWRHQAWNLSYNVSAEFDDYRKRYEWVIEGINFLEEGARYNEDEARLVWDIGWFTAQKIGRADEYKQFRPMFKQDDDFHGSRPLEERDNWLVGKEGFARAEAIVERPDVRLKGIAPVVFYSDRPMCQMNYAETREEEGTFGPKAQQWWNLGHREWTDGPVQVPDQIPFGIRELATAAGRVIRLNDRESKAQEILKLRAELDATAQGVREAIIQERRARLSPPEQEALDTPPEERTGRQHQLFGQAEQKTRVTHLEVAERLSGAQKSRAKELAERLVEAEELERRIGGYRSIVNYESWRRRAQVEQTPQALKARELVYQGSQAFDEGNLSLAKKSYDDAFAAWRQLLDSKEFPNLIESGQFGDQWMDIIKVYRRILAARDEPFPQNFILQDVIDQHEVYEEEE